MIYLAFIEGGHGFNTSGKRTPAIKSLSGRQIKEHEFNEPTATMLAGMLRAAGVHVYDPAPGDRDAPLKERTDYANKVYKQYCDKHGKSNVKAIYVSIHFNALDGVFDTNKNPSGFSVHIYPGHKNKDAGKLAASIINELKNGTKQINRGIVEQDLHIVRETHMVAVLSENGFMDHATEALLMINPAFQKEVAEEHAKGICKYFGIPFKEEPKPKPPAPKPPTTIPGKDSYIHRVIVDGKQVGAFGKAAGVAETVEKAVLAGAKKITIERT